MATTEKVFYMVVEYYIKLIIIENADMSSV
jgi:hypothetical protein